MTSIAINITAPPYSTDVIGDDFETVVADASATLREWMSMGRGVGITVRCDNRAREFEISKRLDQVGWNLWNEAAPRRRANEIGTEPGLATRDGPVQNRRQRRAQAAQRRRG